MKHAATHRGTGEDGKPTLYVVATPIGNLSDITLRAIEVLKTVEVIAAEDTRVTAGLLHHHGIPVKRLLSLHGYNEARILPKLLDVLADGASVALVSDAGTPAISDPGARAVAAVREAGYRVIPIPGPNAAIAALSASGVDTGHFLFCGFLPARAGERQRELERLAPLPFTLVFYEAPHRVIESLRDMQRMLAGNRHVVIARELTKLFESLHACPLGEAASWIEGHADRCKGEFVLIVEGASADAAPSGVEAERILAILLEELPLKQSVSLAARLTGGKRNELYDRALALKRGQGA
jgi:16S rRNA (cytidine1402-2'-O)-methyltransferase